MFPRRERLPRALFPSALKAGRRFSSANFTAILPYDATGYAVVVSKKVARLSVTRHRIKRRVLEALRTLSIPKSLILFPKTSALQLDRQHIQGELADLLSKIRP
ncbi:MAG: ribonuclease P protein component [Minisyncoccota bacterium]